MMQTNPYALLDLNPTGKSNSNQPYTTTEISCAYKARSLKTHPDKNPGNPDAQKNFTQVKEAYTLLINPAERAKFDRTLLENPSLAIHNTHLFVEIGTLPPLPAEHHSRALTLKTTTGVDLTQLIMNSRASSDLILSFAAQKPAFAKALLSHAPTRERLSLQEQFKLIFIILKHQHDHPDFLLNQDEKNIIQYLLNQINVSSSNYGINTTEFVGACVQNRELFLLFAQVYRHFLEALPQSPLFILSQDFYPIISILFNRHAANIRTFEILFLLKKHPDRRRDIVENYRQVSSTENMRKLQLSTWLTERDDLSELMPEIVTLLGMDALRIYIDARIDAKEMPPGMHSFVINFLTLFVLNKPADFFKTLTRDDREQLISGLIGSTDCHELATSIFNDIESIKRFANCLSYEEFRMFVELLPHLVPMPISPSVLQSYYHYVLHHSFEDADQPDHCNLFITRYLQESLHQATQVLTNTPLLLLALLQQPSFASQLATNPVLLNKMAQSAAVARFSDQDVASFAELPNLFLVTYQAFSSFYKNYLTHCGDDPNKNPEIPSTAFFETIKITGFFADLFFIETQDFDVQHHFLEQAVTTPYSDKLLSPAQRNRWRSAFNKQLLSNEHDRVESLLRLYQINHSDLILEILSENMGSPDKLKILARLSTHHDWATRHLSGEHLSLTSSFFTQNYCVTKMLPHFRDVELDASKKNVFQDVGLHQLMTLFNDPSQYSIQQETFTRIVAAFKKTFQQRYPLSYFSSYLTVVDSPLYQHKISAFEALRTHLTSQQPLDPNQSLLRILCLLEGCGINNKTLTLLARHLSQDTCVALCTLITIEKQKYAYQNHDIYSKILAHSAQDEASLNRLSLIFHELAVYAIQKNHKNICGEALNAFALAHGDSILPVIQRHQLGVELYTAKALQRTVETVASQPTISIQSFQLTPEQVVDSLLSELHQLANSTLMRADDANVIETIQEFQAKILGAIRINELSNTILSKLMNTYIQPRNHLEAKKVLITWLLKLTLVNHQASKDKLLALLASPETESLALACLTDYFIHPQAACSIETIHSFFGDRITGNIVTTHLQRVSPPNEPSLLTDINALLLNHRLSLNVLSQLTAEHFVIVRRFAHYLNSAVFTKTLDLQQAPFTLTAEQLPWFILFDQDILTPIDFQALDKKSIPYLSYLTLTQTELPLAQALQKMQDIKTILTHQQIIFLQSNIIQPIQNEIIRLVSDNETHKEEILKAALTEITMHIVNIIDTQTSTLLQQGVNSLILSVQNKLKALVKHPGLDTHRSVFNSLMLMGLGYTLWTIALPIPGVSSDIGFFRRPTVVQTMKNLSDSLSRQQ
ncbi:MAG: J domain-containing protein [Gammaproteobacteria bacterium]|nr:J domain-containing protein [Gammaproteobacteria bacterium]